MSKMLSKTSGISYEPYGEEEKKEVKWEKGEDYPDSQKDSPKPDVKKSPLYHGLSTRYSPDRVGVQAVRVRDGVVADPYTGKEYDYNEGFEREDGTIVPGGSPSLQSKLN